MGTKNCVIAGDYNGKPVNCSFGTVSIITGFASNVIINKTTVEEYEIVDESYKKSAGSAIGRAAVGSFFLGPVGLLAGVSAKSKGKHTIAIAFKDGKKSLIEVDDKTKKAILTSLF